MKYDLHTGDCLSVMPTLPEDSVDTIITDPPYCLSTIHKRFAKSTEDNEHHLMETLGTNPFARVAKGFMGKEWDNDVAFRVETWQAALRVAKPGAILMAFGGTRTYHRLTCAIEDAGWEIRDCMMWLYGSGFPKSLDIGKAIDGLRGNERGIVGTKRCGIADGPFGSCEEERKHILETKGDSEWEGYGTALKPAWEPIIVAQSPLDGTYAENAQKWGVAGLNIDGGRIGTETVPINHLDQWSGFGEEKCPGYQQEINNKGRWPANLLLDEDSARLLPSGASRFFYTAKASPSERNAGLERNTHPTVKPVDLMRYLCKLTKTPTGGVVLDPFMGSGTTGIACVLEGRDFIGIELNEDYAAIARKRIDEATGPLFVPPQQPANYLWN